MMQQKLDCDAKTCLHLAACNSASAFTVVLNHFGESSIDQEFVAQHVKNLAILLKLSSSATKKIVDLSGNIPAHFHAQLLCHDDQLNFANSFGITPVMNHLQQRQHIAASVLSRVDCSDFEDEHHATALHYYCKFYVTSMRLDQALDLKLFITVLLKQKASITKRNIHNQTPLMLLIGQHFEYPLLGLVSILRSATNTEIIQELRSCAHNLQNHKWTQALA